MTREAESKAFSSQHVPLLVLKRTEISTLVDPERKVITLVAHNGGTTAAYNVRAHSIVLDSTSRVFTEGENRFNSDTIHVGEDGRISLMSTDEFASNVGWVPGRVEHQPIDTAANLESARLLVLIRYSGPFDASRAISFELHAYR